MRSGKITLETYFETKQVNLDPPKMLAHEDTFVVPLTKQTLRTPSQPESPLVKETSKYLSSTNAGVSSQTLRSGIAKKKSAARTNLPTDMVLEGWNTRACQYAGAHLLKKNSLESYSWQFEPLRKYCSFHDLLRTFCAFSDVLHRSKRENYFGEICMSRKIIVSLAACACA